MTTFLASNLFNFILYRFVLKLAKSIFIDWAFLTILNKLHDLLDLAALVWTDRLHPLFLPKTVYPMVSLCHFIGKIVCLYVLKLVEMTLSLIHPYEMQTC